MLFGHNSNVTVGTDTVHVQTEDRGENHAFIDTTVHWKGRVLHRRTNNYKDLLPLDAERETTLKARLDDQHRAVIAEIRTGALKLAFPTAPPKTTAKPTIVAPLVLKVELINARSWLAGKHATLQIVVKDGTGAVIAGAEARARVEGAANPEQYSGRTGIDGGATLQFEMPKLSGPEIALVIEASHGVAKGHLRFQLRAKPRA
jgi:hypothetical protein